MTTVAPRERSKLAVARPMPEEPPLSVFVSNDDEKKEPSRKEVVVEAYLS